MNFLIHVRAGQDLLLVMIDDPGVVVAKASPEISKS
jgi:hypothetical protein